MLPPWWRMPPPPRRRRRHSGGCARASASCSFAYRHAFIMPLERERRFAVTRGSTRRHPGTGPAAKHCSIGVGSGVCPVSDQRAIQETIPGLTRAPGTRRFAAIPTTCRKLASATPTAKQFFRSAGLREWSAYGRRRRVMARSIPARSGRAETANPAAAASRATLSAWPCPASKIAAPPGASSPDRRGNMTR